MDGERLNELWAKVHARQAAIWRLYPHAKIRFGRGGGAYDPGQPSVAFVVFSDDSHGVVYDHVLTLLLREIDDAMDVQPITLEEDHPVKLMSEFIETMFELAQSPETWTDEVKATWERFVSRQEVDDDRTDSAR